MGAVAKMLKIIYINTCNAKFLKTETKLSYCVQQTDPAKI